MNPERSSLTGKLILLVLCLILGCLVILVVRAYREPIQRAETFEPAYQAETAEPSTTEALLPAPIDSNSSRRATTNGIRLTPKAQKQPSFPPEALASQVGSVPNDGAHGIPQAATILSAVHVSSEVAGPVSRPVPVYSNAPAIIGRVTLVGTPKPEVPIQMGPTCSRINPAPVTTRHYVVSPDGGLANVLVWIKDAPAMRVSGDGPLLDQVGCMFEPYVLGVLVNQPVRIRNSDPELHSIHATPQLNREFNISQSYRGKLTEKSFAHPEVFVRLKCDVHPWMFAYVNVLEHPFFAITDTNGVYQIPAGFSSGKYTLAAAHLKAGEMTQKVFLEQGQLVELDFQFEVTVSREQRGGVASRH